MVHAALGDMNRAQHAWRLARRQSAAPSLVCSGVKSTACSGCCHGCGSSCLGARAIAAAADRRSCRGACSGRCCGCGSSCPGACSSRSRCSRGCNNVAAVAHAAAAAMAATAALPWRLWLWRQLVAHAPQRPPPRLAACGATYCPVNASRLFNKQMLWAVTLYLTTVCRWPWRHDGLPIDRCCA